MANLDSTLGAEQVGSTIAGKCVSPTSWNVLAFGIQLDKMPFFPWRRYKQFLEKPLMVGIGGFGLQYFCNDLNDTVQNQGYGVIRFIPYIVIFSIAFAVSVFWWIFYGRRQGLETLPRHRQDIQTNETQQPSQEIQRNRTPRARDVHRQDIQMNETQQPSQENQRNKTPQAGDVHCQDIQMNETQQPSQEIQRNETPQAGDVQIDQALQGFFIRTEEFCSLMDCWFSTRLGEMTRDEALGKMKQLVETGNRRSRDVSIESTANETRAVVNESLETRRNGSRRLSARSIVDGTHNPIFPILCPGAANSNNHARSSSHEFLVLKIPQNVNVGELGEIYDANLPGCRELHKRIEIGPEDGDLRQVLASQILESLRTAWTLDENSTIQVGSFAILKLTDGGVKCWMLQEHWTPTILDIHRSSQNLLEVLTGERANWTIRGFNLRDAALRFATVEKSENLTNSLQYKTENGADLILFKEPPSLPMFMRGVFLSASSIVQLEEGVSLKLHSQAIKVQQAFWISVVDAFILKPWTVGMITILSLLLHYLVAWHFATILPILVATYFYLLQDHVPQQGSDVSIRGVAPLVEEFGNVTDPDSRTLSEENLAEMDMPIEQKGGPVEGSKTRLGESSSASKSGTPTHALEDLVVRKGGLPMEATRLNGASTVSDSTLGCVFAHLDNPADRSAVSRVCKQWKEVDSKTRKHVEIANCYSIAPAALSRRFPNLKSLKIKGQPRALDYGLVPLNWGGHAAPWIAEVARAYAPAFESLWLRQMQVTDEDLLLLAQSCPDLLTLKLEKCLGFSPVGLAYITANCRSLKVLFLAECTILESDSSSEWLHELAVKNPNLIGRAEFPVRYSQGKFPILRQLTLKNAPKKSISRGNRRLHLTMVHR